METAVYIISKGVQTPALPTLIGKRHSTDIVDTGRASGSQRPGFDSDATSLLLRYRLLPNMFIRSQSYDRELPQRRE
jgi:hypothetical protein